MQLPKLTPPIAKAPEAAKGPTAVRSLPMASAAWSLLGGIGVLLAVVGGADIALIWVPLAFGNPEWEFGTLTSTFDSLPVLTLGLGLALVATYDADATRVRRLIRTLFGVIAVALIAGGVLYLTLLPMALRALSDPAVQIGLFRAMVKTAIQAVAYPTLYLWIALRRFG
jgi:hypothetical protein